MSGGASARRALSQTWSQLPALTQVLVTFGFAAMGCVAFAAADQLLGTRSMSKDSLHPVLLGSGIILSLVLGSTAFHVRKRSMQARAIADSKRELEQILAAATRVAIIAADREGVIRHAFIDVDYARRMEPADILTALRTLAGAQRG